MDTAELIQSLEKDAQRLQERRAQLERELKDVLEQLKNTHTTLETIRSYADDKKKPLEGQSPLLRLDEMTIADGAAAILESRGGQARATEIISTLQKAGKMKSEGRQAYSTLVQALQRSPARFRKIRPGVWALVRADERAGSTKDRLERIGEVLDAWRSREENVSLVDAAANMSTMEPSLLDAVKNMPTIEPSLLDAVKNMPKIDPSVLDAVKNMPKIDPSVLDALTNMPKIDPSVLDAFKNMPEIDPSVLDAFKNMSKSVQPPTG